MIMTVVVFLLLAAAADNGEQQWWGGDDGGDRGQHLVSVGWLASRLVAAGAVADNYNGSRIRR
jgi:hypothetical protein